MTDIQLSFEVSQFVTREAQLLDDKNWKEWLSLFTQDVEYWVPAWASESELTSDPGNELSMVYIQGRGGLEDRVFRIESGDSFASMPIDRTAHVVGGVLIHTVTGPDVGATASWIARSFGSRGARTLCGHYDYNLKRTSEGLRIARKRIVLLDDRIDGPVDIYHL